MPRSLTLPALALLALAACDGETTQPDDRFAPGRVVVRVEKDGSRDDLTLDAPVAAVHAVSALDSAHAFTLALAGDLEGFDETRPSPMLELFIPGPLAVRSYPVGLLDVSTADVLSPVGKTTALGAIVAGRGDETSYFATTGGTVEVVDLQAPSARLPGHIRARLAMELRELAPDGEPFGFGGSATGRGTLDGLVVRTLASDAELAFSGAFTGAATRDLLGGAFGGVRGSNRDLLFLTGPQGGTTGGFGTLDLHLSRIPGAGETLRFAPIPPETLRQRAGTAADTLSSAMLQVFDVTNPSGSMQEYVTTGGQLRVTSTTAEAARGTLSLTLTQIDRSTGRLGTRTVSASGQIGISLSPALPLLNRRR